MHIFGGGAEDYELRYAVEYLEKEE
jgi:hypothetical protein